MKGTFDLKEGPSSGYQTARTMRKTQRGLVGGDLNTGDGLGCKIEDRAAKKNPGKYALCKNSNCTTFRLQWHLYCGNDSKCKTKLQKEKNGATRNATF